MNQQTIRVKKGEDEDWVTARLLNVALGWVEVDDGNELLWVAPSQVHPYDRIRLATRTIIQSSRRLQRSRRVRSFSTTLSSPGCRLPR